MTVDKIEFTQGEEGAVPSSVSGTFSIEEALWIAKVAGQQRGTSPHNDLYDGLVDDLFNRYWEDGIDGAQREFRVQTPPVHYED